MNKTFATATAAVIFLSAAAGCHSGTGEDVSGGAGVAEVAANRPALHATLQWERLYNGKNVPRENYATLVQHCKDAGWPMQELAPADVQKLGKGMVELWQDARGAYGRQTVWDLTVVDAGERNCVAKLKETVSDESQSFRELDGTPIEIAPVDSAEVVATAKLLGFTRVGESQVKGQPCTRWRSKNHEECVWSGGLDIGMSDAPTDSLCTTLGPMAYLAGLPLESRHGSQGPGCNLELVTMTVGKGLLPEVGRAMAELDAPATAD